MIGQKYIVQFPCRVFASKAGVGTIALAHPDHLNVEVYAHSPDEAAERVANGIACGISLSKRGFSAVPDEKLGAVALRNGPRTNEECLQLVSISEEEADTLDDLNEYGNVESAKRILEKASKR